MRRSWEEIMRIAILPFTLLLGLPAMCLSARAQNANPPVAGTVQSYDGKTLTLKKDDGSMVAASLAPNATITQSVKKTVADIRPGDFVASGGTRGADGKIHANEIRIFTGGARGEGQFPMSQPGQVMTNATVKEVMTDATVKQVGSAGGRPVIKLSFHGAGAPGAADCTGRSADAPGGDGKGCVGETEFDVPADTPVVAQMPGDASLFKPGAKASMTLANGSATRVTVSQ
jgi:hypothetical protein